MIANDNMTLDPKNRRERKMSEESDVWILTVNTPTLCLKAAAHFKPNTYYTISAIQLILADFWSKWVVM